MSTSRKKLPRAIRGKPDEIFRPPVYVRTEPTTIASTTSRPVRSEPVALAVPTAAPAKLIDVREASLPVPLHDPVAVTASRQETLPPEPPRDRPTNSEIDAARRLSQARAIVERHATYSAIGGIIPLPIVNVGSVTTVIVRMVKSLSDLYGIPFERDRARGIVLGLMGGAMPTGLAAVTTSTLLYVIPGSNLVGLAVSSIAAAACTRSIGRIFVERFESGTTLKDF
ncbi:MAG: hypothetical protein C5B56_08810 [Proteobacteria bacterium]|nr:MAG: hypothetical protein C5B56_08810 [Pseudomonadota bacterium]